MTGELRDVLPAAAALLGVPGGQDRLGLRERVPADVRRVVVVLVDGLGSELLPLLASRAPLLAAAVARSGGSLPLRCAFPSTTPVSLVGLGTGAAPGEHGVLAFTSAVPGRDTLLTHIFWRDDPPPRSWQPLPTWFERVAAAGMAASVVLPEAFRGSGLTDAAYRGAAFLGVGADDDPAALLLRTVRGAPGLSYGYTSLLDTAAHVHGVGSPEWLGAASAVDAYLARLVEGLPEDAVLLVTGDHGGLNVDRDRSVDLADEPVLRDGLELVAGEPRARYLHTRPGAADDVAAAWRGVLGDRASVVLRDEAIAAGWFGRVADAHRPRIGDVVVVCTGAVGVFATGQEPPAVAELVGVHGGMEPAETDIPLVVVAGESRGSVSTSGAR